VFGADVIDDGFIFVIVVGLVFFFCGLADGDDDVYLRRYDEWRVCDPEERR